MPAQLRKQHIRENSYGTVKIYPGRVQPVHIKKKKKKNPLLALVRFLFCCAFLSVFCYVIAPVLYTDYFEPLILNHILNRKVNADMSRYVSVHLDYLHNSWLFGRNLLVPAQKSSKELVSIVRSGELTTTKSMLEDLFKKYPNMHPSVYVWEYSSAKEVNINADESFSAASIIKLPVLFELFRKIDRSGKLGTNETSLSKKLLYNDINRTSGSGQLQYMPLNRKLSVDYLAKIMITQSDNSATNMLIEEAGGMAAINSSMRSLGLDEIKLQNRLPDLEGTNKITARQIATLLYNLDNPRFLSQKSKITIKEYMANVENRRLLQAGLPPEAILIHKTGDIGKMLGDAGVVYAQNGRKYIVVILVKRPHNDYSARDMIQEASRIIYKNINSGIDVM